MFNDSERITEELASSATRRQVLVRAGGGLLALSGASMLAACGGSGASGGTSASGAAAGGTPKAGGTFVLGMGGGSSTTNASPFTAYGETPANVPLVNNIFDTLVIRDPQTSKTVNVLAEEFVPSKPGRVDSWDVRLRDGVEFHDGKTLTADDVIFSAQQRFKKSYAGDPGFELIDIKRIKKLDARTVRMPLIQPYATFPDHLSSPDLAIVHAGFDPSKPIGTGPFKFVSGQPGERWQLAANKRFWGEGPYFAALVIQEFADENARANALRSGQVTALGNLPGAQLRVVQAGPGVHVLESRTGMNLVMTMRCDLAPYNDPRVRQALRLIANRQQMVDQALDGKGVVGNDLYGVTDADFDSSLPPRKQDVAQAKALLAAAGHANTEFELISSPIYGGIDEACQVYAQQAQDAGVNVKYRRLDTATWSAGYRKWPFSVSYYYNRSMLDVAAGMNSPASTYNEAHFDDPEWNRLFAAATVEIDAGKRRDLIHRMQAVEYERGGYIIWSHPDTNDAFSSQVVGFRPDNSGIGLNQMRFDRVGFAA